MEREKKKIRNPLCNKMISIALFSLAVFFIFSMIYIIFATTIQVNLDTLSKEEVVNSEMLLIDVEKDILTNRIERLTTDLLYVADTYELYNEDPSTKYMQLEKQWILFSNRKGIYDQIRFIDVDGNEKIRINYNDAGAYAVKENNLQNKKDRYYFLESMALNKEEIYISELDLNVENCEIENPIKPTIRLSTPIYNSKGELEGIVVLNYLAEDMLNQMRKIASTSQGFIFLLNEDGYWLYNGENSAKEWGFMYENRMDENFQYIFDTEWEEIKENKDGFISSVFGVFCYTTMLTSDDLYIEELDQSIASSEGIWRIVSYIPSGSETGQLFSMNIGMIISHIVRENKLILIMLAIFAMAIAFLVTLNIFEKNKIKYYSEFDAMTGAYNRRAGFERLDRIYKEATKKSIKTSLCFIDINGLKEVNDGLGHDTGDELILSIVEVIKKNMRETDFIARFGGDEFLIIFYGMDEEESEKVWTRIHNEFDRINETEQRKYLISVSHGIEEFQFSASEYIDSIINEADEKMYTEKRRIKEELKVLR